MSEEEFESYLRLMGRFLKLNDQQRGAIKTELRDHMEERLTELIARGHSREQAIEAALDEFGDAAAIASDFGKIGRRRKWIMRTATSTVGIAATVLIVSFLLPENRPTVPAPGYTLAQNESPSAGASKSSAAKDHDEDVSSRRTERAVLDKVLPSLDFQETPFEEVIDYLRDQIDINVYVNWNAVHEEGIDVAVPITLDLKNIPFGQGLDFVLLEAAEGQGFLAYRIEGNVLIISTVDELGSKTEVRIYDCRDLINGPSTGPKQEQARAPHGMGGFGRTGSATWPQPQTLAAYVRAELANEQRLVANPNARSKTSATEARACLEDALQLALVQQTFAQAPTTPPVARATAADAVPLTAPQPKNTLGSSASWLPTNAPSTGFSRSARSAEQHRANDFVDMIVSTIASDSWQQRGGAIGSISEYDGFLIVRQTEPIHQQIDELLDMLRDAVKERGEVRKAEAKHDPALVPHDHDPYAPHASIQSNEPSVFPAPTNR